MRKLYLFIAGQEWWIIVDIIMQMVKMRFTLMEEAECELLQMTRSGKKKRCGGGTRCERGSCGFELLKSTALNHRMGLGMK
jgi:hypothetical protein